MVHEEVQLLISIPVTSGSRPEPTLSPYAALQPEELTLLLVQLRRHQAKVADAFTHLHNDGLSGPSLQVRGSEVTGVRRSLNQIRTCCIVAPVFFFFPQIPFFCLSVPLCARLCSVGRDVMAVV